LLQAGRPEEALSLLYTDDDVGGINRIDAELLKAEAHLCLGTLSEARDRLQDALADIATHDLSHLRPRAEALAQRL
jgi:hypothetical protein